jgi:hypothetical protein
MKIKSWNILVLLTISITAGSFLFIFTENKIEPELAGIPFIFWTSFLLSVLVVFATFLGSKLFASNDSKKP